MQAIADKITENPTRAFGAGFAGLSVASFLAAVLSPWIGELLTPMGAQALLFALILSAIIAAVAIPLTAFSDFIGSQFELQ